MAEPKIATHNDEPVSKCSLQRKELTDLITQQIIYSTPPKAIAIHGTWGTGKTSLMMQVYESLGGAVFKMKEGEEIKNESKIAGITIRPVWFEAWQYQQETNILAALLKEIRDQLAWYHKIWREVKETAVPGVMALLQSVDVTFKNFGNEYGLKSFGSKFVENEKAYQKEQYSTPLESINLKRLLEDAINKLLGLKESIKRLNRGYAPSATQGKVVIFIDDLDRCEPDTAFRILEAIKIYLNLKNCVFVLGMDMEAVERIIAKYYEKMLVPDKDGNSHHVRLKDLARLYLEKICQDTYHLPAPDMEVRRAYFKELLDGKLNEPAETNGKLVGDILKLGKEHGFLPPFPRSIKILANVLISFCSRESIRQYAQKGPKEVQRLLIFAYLYAFHYELYNLSFLYLDKGFYNGTFLKFCQTPNDFTLEKKNEHPLLKHLIVPEDITASEALSGKTATQQAENYLARLFPHESLRQVLWVRNLVIKAGDIPDTDIKLLKL